MMWWRLKLSEMWKANAEAWDRRRLFKEFGDWDFCTSCQQIISRRKVCPWSVFSSWIILLIFQTWKKWNNEFSEDVRVHAIYAFFFCVWSKIKQLPRWKGTRHVLHLILVSLCLPFLRQTFAVVWLLREAHDVRAPGASLIAASFLGVGGSDEASFFHLPCHAWWKIVFPKSNNPGWIVLVCTWLYMSRCHLLDRL